MVGIEKRETLVNDSTLGVKSGKGQI